MIEVKMELEFIDWFYNAACIEEQQIILEIVSAYVYGGLLNECKKNIRELDFMITHQRLKFKYPHNPILIGGIIEITTKDGKEKYRIDDYLSLMVHDYIHLYSLYKNGVA